MSLTQAQWTALRTHLLANTNTVVNLATGQPAQIKNLLADASGNYQQIADWYNGTALAADAQPFAAPLNVWVPNLSTAVLKTAINWQTPPAGADPPTIANSWAQWAAMTIGGYLDMTDAQTRHGVAVVWGNYAAGNTTAGIAAAGQQSARRIDLVLQTKGLVGNTTFTGPQAYVSLVYGYALTEGDVREAVDNG